MELASRVPVPFANCILPLVLSLYLIARLDPNRFADIPYVEAYTSVCKAFNLPPVGTDTDLDTRRTVLRPVTQTR